MSNSRSFRRKVKASQHVRPAGSQQAAQYAKGHVPWNKGRALTTRPSYRTVHRWLQECVAEGSVERKTAEPDGKPGRPPVLYRLTEKGRVRPAASPEVRRVQMKQLRRWENARQRGREQRYAREMARLEAEADRLGRRVTVLRGAAEQAQADLDLAAEMVVHATEALLASSEKTPAELHPEEVDALVEYGCADPNGDGALMLNPAWLEEFGRVGSHPA